MAKATLYKFVYQFTDDFVTIEEYKLYFPISPSQVDELKRQRLSHEFSKLSRGVVQGCLGAGDGIVIKIQKPTNKETENAKEFWNRKGVCALCVCVVNNCVLCLFAGYYAVVLQAVCDADRIFTYASCQTYGNTHDSLAFDMSALGQALSKGELRHPYFIVGDEAYRCTNHVLTPFSGSKLSRDKDSFNFYQSRMRIPIECSFGSLTQRWGILWRALRFSLRRIPKLLVSLLMLNNIATRSGLKSRNMATKTAETMRKQNRRMFLLSFRNLGIGGRRRDLDQSNRRMDIVDDLRRAGLVRPARSHWGLNRSLESR